MSEIFLEELGVPARVEPAREAERPDVVLISGYGKDTSRRTAACRRASTALKETPANGLLRRRLTSSIRPVEP
jgi:hypothetical protein